MESLQKNISVLYLNFDVTMLIKRNRCVGNNSFSGVTTTWHPYFVSVELQVNRKKFHKPASIGNQWKRALLNFTPIFIFFLNTLFNPFHAFLSSHVRNLIHSKHVDVFGINISSIKRTGENLCRFFPLVSGADVFHWAIFCYEAP